MRPEDYPTGHSESELSTQEAQPRLDLNRGVAENAEPDNLKPSLLSPLPGARGEEMQKSGGASDLGVEEVQPWAEPVDGAALLDELRNALTRHVVLPPHASETLALWILHTYAFELRSVSTYVGIVSPEKRCGKTTLLSLLALLANRPIIAANISPSALFRVIEELRPTLLIDEADTLLQGNEEMRGILNSGYSKDGAYVMRVAQMRNVEGGAASESSNGDVRKTRLARFSCWCPKVMAAIGCLPDTLADRSIVITMQRKTFGEECERLRKLEAKPLRRKCARFVRDHAAEIGQLKPQVPPALNDRAADIWEPLLALAELAGGEWPGLAREAAVKLSGEAQESSATATLFYDIFLMLMSSGRERIFSRELVQYLSGLQERPWAQARKGKPLTELTLSYLLRPYGIRSRTIWIGEQSAKGYLTEDFTEAVKRYALPLVQQMIQEHQARKAAAASNTGETTAAPEAV